MIQQTLLLFLLFSSSLLADTLKHSSNYNEAILEAKKQNKKLMLFVYSTYCPWCKKMEQTTLQNKDVIKYVNENYIFVAVNRDRDNFPSKFQPYGVPTTYVINPNNEEKLFTMKGYKSSSAFLNRVKR